MSAKPPELDIASPNQQWSLRAVGHLLLLMSQASGLSIIRMHVHLFACMNLLIRPQILRDGPSAQRHCAQQRMMLKESFCPWSAYLSSSQTVSCGFPERCGNQPAEPWNLHEKHAALSRIIFQMRSHSQWPYRNRLMNSFLEAPQARWIHLFGTMAEVSKLCCMIL